MQDTEKKYFLGGAVQKNYILSRHFCWGGGGDPCPLRKYRFLLCLKRLDVYDSCPRSPGGGANGLSGHIRYEYIFFVRLPLVVGPLRPLSLSSRLVAWTVTTQKRSFFGLHICTLYSIYREDIELHGQRGG